MQKFARTRCLTTLLVTALLGLTACGGGGAASTTPAAPTPTTVGTSSETTAGGTTGTTTDGVISDVSNDPAAFEALVAAAEAEGTVTYYTSTSTEDMEELEVMFEELYDVDLVTVRSGGTEILQRFLLERDSGTVLADLLGHSEGGAWLDSYDDGQIECFKPRFYDDLYDYAKGPDDCFAADNGSVMGIVYRTDLLEQAGIEPPTSWQALLDPALNGQLAIPNPNFSSFVTVIVTVMSEEMGWEYFEGLKANDPLVLPGGGALLEALEAGEVMVAGMSTAGRPTRAMLDGLPIAYVYPEEGSYVSSSYSAVPVGAPHPNAGKLLADFLLTDEVQEFFLNNGSYPGRQGFPAPQGMRPLEEINSLPIDYRFVSANSEERVAIYTDIFDAPTEE